MLMHALVSQLSPRNGCLHNFEPSITTRMITTNQPVLKYTAFDFLDQTPARIKPTSSQDLDSLESQLSADDCNEIDEFTTGNFAHVQMMTSSDFSLPLTALEPSLFNNERI